jgi:hypothetical protein
VNKREGQRDVDDRHRAVYQELLENASGDLSPARVPAITGSVDRVRWSQRLPGSTTGRDDRSLRPAARRDCAGQAVVLCDGDVAQRLCAGSFG